MILSRVLSHFHRATSISICGYCFLVGISYVQKHSSWKDNEIVYCHLLTRNLASFSVRQLPDGPTRGWLSFPRFSLVLLLNCPPNMCRTLNPLVQLHKMWILCNVLKTYLVYCSLNRDSPYTFKYLNNGGSIQNDNTDSKCEIFLQGDQMPRCQSVASQP